MTSDKPPAKLLPFERPWRFPGDLERFRTMLDDDDVAFEESDIDDGFACAKAAIAKGVPGGHEVKADLLNMRAHRILATGDTDAAVAAWDALIDLYPTHFPAASMRADLFEKGGDHEAAMAVLDRFIERSPTDARGYLHRSKLYTAKGDADRALANLRRAAQLDPTSVEAHLGVAQALAAKGDADGAARAYARAADAEVPGDAESYNMRAFMFFVSGQDELALADYEASLALSPNQVDALVWRGILRLRLKRVDAAIADFTRVISMRPSEARGFRRRGEALVSAGRPTEALRDLDRALELDGDNKGAAHSARGNAYEALGDLKAALASYDAALECDPSNVGARVHRFQIHANASDWQKCQVDAEAMLARTPDQPPLLHTHARLCIKTGRRDDALVAYDRLIALDPKNADAYYERSEIHVGRGDSLAARADRARAFEFAPDNLEFRAAYGCDQVGLAKTDEERAVAFRLIASSAELDAENPEAWARAAYRFRQCGHPGEAIPFITRAAELDPNNADYPSERATCIRCSAAPVWMDPASHKASCVAALADVERAIAISSKEDLELYRQRASLREETGDIEGAIADQTTMIEMDPSFMDAHVDRARLRKLTGDMPGALADAACVAAMEDELIAEFAAHPDPPKWERFDLNKA